MLKKQIKILSITPTKHIAGVNKQLEKIGFVKYLSDPSYLQVKKIINGFDAIFTNPNKSKVSIDRNIIDTSKKLKVICTASTGTDHIDLKAAKEKKIKVICLKDSKKVINKISSTAEHALALTLSSLRNLSESHDSVKKGNWDYTKFIGRQIDFLVVGIIGFGRLGKLYSRYMRAFNCKIIVYDPYKKINNKYVKKVNNLNYLFKNSDIISIHVHLKKETKNLLNEKSFSFMKKNVLIVNTSRGDIVNENELIRFLKKNKKAKYATDVLSNEINSRKNHSLILQSHQLCYYHKILEPEPIRLFLALPLDDVYNKEFLLSMRQ